MESRSACVFAKQRDGQETPLFEGGNPLPFFWLMLLSEDDIRRYSEKIKQAVHTHTIPDDTSIALDKLKALIRATGRRGYIEKYYTSCLPLFDDWIHFLQISDFADMKIYVDLYEVSTCYPNPDAFEESLQRAIAGFDKNEQAWYENTVAGTCGYEARNKNKRRFADFSESYRDKNKKDIYGHFDQRIHLGKTMSPRKRLLLTVLVLTAIVFLIIGIVALLYWMK